MSAAVPPATRVLLVEDYPPYARSLRLLLANAPTGAFSVLDVGTLGEAIEALRRDRFDVVLLDLGLPDSTGLDGLTRVLATGAHVPVVVLTGHAEDSIATAALQSGAEDFLVKDEIAEPRMLSRAIRYAIERNRAEQALRDTFDQLRQSQKMEALGRLAGGLAHDLNSILTAILGYADLVRQSLHVDDPRGQEMDEIIRAGERATALTRRVLAFSRKQEVSPRLLDLNAIVADLSKMLRRLIGEHIALRIEADRELGVVRADAAQIEQVILNLALNARDAMPSGGTLTIATERARTSSGEPAVALSVSDTGVGMDSATVQHVFEPYFTTKEPGRGTGLGLATVYGIAVQHGGTVDVSTAPGRGATFRLVLPCVEAPADEDEPPPPSSMHPVPHGETILVVEDDDSVRAFARRALASAGYQVLEGRNGAHALEVSSAHAGVIDLLLTDVVMPELGGVELAHALAPLRPGLRVLYASGYVGDAELDAPVLAKPYRLDALLVTVRAALDDRAPRS